MYNNSLLIGQYLSTTGINNKNSIIIKKSKMINSNTVGITTHKAPIQKNNKTIKK